MTAAGAKLDTNGANFDPAEIARFDAMAAWWWDKDGANRALHDINRPRLGYIARRARLHGRRVLDVGCGGGVLAEALAAAGAHVVGIDLAEASLAVAREHLHVAGVHVDYHRITVEALANREAGRFDVVTCMEMLEHVPHPAKVVSACAALLRPGGNLFCASINRNLLAWLLAIVAAEYLLGLLPRGTHTYRKLVKPGELRRWAQTGGLQFMDLTALHYLPFIRRCVLGGPAHTNYMMHFRKPPTVAAGE